MTEVYSGTYYYYGINPLTDTNLVDGSIVNYGWTSGDFEYTLQDQTQEQQNFTEKIIESLFKIESGDIQQVISGIIQNTRLNEMGQVSGELAMLNVLTGEPSDFVISWQPAIYEGQVIIPSGDINFSARVREIPALYNIMQWVHIIMGLAVTSVFTAEIWFTLLKVLGVGTSIYDQQQDEIAKMEEQVYVTKTEDAAGRTNVRLTRRRRLK